MTLSAPAVEEIQLPEIGPGQEASQQLRVMGVNGVSSPWKMAEREMLTRIAAAGEAEVAAARQLLDGRAGGFADPVLMGELLCCETVGGLGGWVEGGELQSDGAELAGGEEGGGDGDAFQGGEDGAVRALDGRHCGGVSGVSWGLRLGRCEKRR